MDFSELNSENQDLVQKRDLVIYNPSDLKAWRGLLDAAHAQDEGGAVSKYSPPQVISSTRKVFEELLDRFPVLPDVWIRYAEWEFKVTDSETTQVVYEKGVAACPSSLALWMSYIEFQNLCIHDDTESRRFFERCVSTCGLDFNSSRIWDKYIEFEDQRDDKHNLLYICERLLSFPHYRYSTYYEKLIRDIDVVPTDKLAPEKLRREWASDIVRTPGQAPKTVQEMDLAIRQRAIGQLEANKLAKMNVVGRVWKIDADCTATNLETHGDKEETLKLWSDYMDQVETWGSHQLIIYYYHRALAVTAYREEVWLKLIRYMSKKGCKGAEIRSVFECAISKFLNSSSTEVRRQYALFEESEGNPEAAYGMYLSIIESRPEDSNTVTEYAKCKLRNDGIESAVGVIDQLYASDNFDGEMKATLIGQGAVMLYDNTGNVDRVREYYLQKHSEFINVPYFWKSFLSFELMVPGQGQLAPAKALIDSIRSNSQLPADDIKEMSKDYQEWMLKRGGSDISKAYIEFEKGL